MSVGKLQRNGLPFSNVIATGVATNTVTAGRTIENLRLKLGGTALTKAMLTLIKIKANGKVVIEVTGSQMDALNKYAGETVNAAYLDIPFAKYKMRDELSRQVGAFDTSSGIANITSEVTITGATAPTMSMILTESAAQKVQGGRAAPYAGLMSKILAYPYSVAAGGTLPLTVPFGPQNGAIITRFHVYNSGGLMTGATVKQDGLVIHESLLAENDAFNTRMGWTPQTNYYTIDFVPDGNVKNALNTRDAKSLEWLLAFSGADSGTVLVEYLDPLGNL